MKKTICICDRCGKPYEDKRFANHCRMEFAVVYKRPFSQQICQKDLCPECLDSLDKWFSEGEGWIKGLLSSGHRSSDRMD